MNQPADDLLVFDEPDTTEVTPIATAEWKVLLVDDDHDVHATTRLALGNVHIEGRPLSIQSAYSAAQAKEVLSGQDDFALAIVDVVMEDENAGLNLVRHIREELGNHNIRIILRTGQPGYAPEIETIKNLDINDYKTKSELTLTRLFSCITIALRAYALICRLDAGRKGLEQVLSSMQKLANPSGLGNFSAGLVAQLCALLHVPSECMVFAVQESPDPYPVILAGGGIYWDWIGMPVNTLPDQRISASLQRTLATRLTTYEDGANLFIASNDERAFAAFIDMPRSLSDVERQLLDVFCSNLSATLENLQTFAAVNSLAYTDADMAIPNRNALQRAIEAAKSPDCQLVLVDIDHFSAFQDRADEHFADSVLVSVAIRLSTSFSDRTCVARLGAGVFGVFGPSEAVTLDSIHGLFYAPFTIEEVDPLRLSATLGAACLSDVGAEQPSLFKCAEMALQRAKLVHCGNGVQFDAPMLDATRARQQISKDLQAAAVSNQPCLHYHPFVNLQTGAFTGAKALLRWPDAHGHTTLAEQFIPIAEQSGLVIRLGYWVLERALAWRTGIGPMVATTFRVAVNASPVQLREPDFVQQLQAIIARSGAQASQLELELTGFNAAFDDLVLRARLVALHKLGVSVATDDYGNGYTALIGLQSLSLKRFKIGASAFASPATDASDSSISKVLMTLASQLKWQSCAEGIETEDQLLRLKAEGCEEGQGNCLCPPLTEAAFADRLNAHSTQH